MFKLILISFLALCTNVVKAQQKLSFDYQRIKAHPRLLLLENEERLIHQQISKNDEIRNVHQYIIEQSDNLLATSPLIYQKIGKRLLSVSRQALQRLYYLSYAYRMTGNKAYLDRANKELNALCDFEDWNPSHFLDVAEMSMAIAIAYDWLYNDLPSETKQKVRNSLVNKAFKPSFNKSYNWFLKAENNWNSVCNAGLTLAALSIFEDAQEESIKIIERALVSVKLPLAAYAPDGNYPEGPNYWNYGTSYQVMLIAGLESALESDNGMSQSPGFMNTAEYMLYSSGSSNLAFNYADNGQAVSANTTMFWFADKLKDNSLLYREMQLMKGNYYTSKIASGESRMLPNVMVFAKKLNLDNVLAPSKNFYVGHGISPVAMVRTNWQSGKGNYLGVKAGTGSAPHAHLDQGSFVYDIGNIRWAMDFGSQNYNTIESKGVGLWDMRQSSARWQLFRYTNFNHNTLSINNQNHNVAAKAQIVETYNDDLNKGAKIDLTNVLNLNDELKSAFRKIIIQNNNQLVVEDEIVNGGKEVSLRWNMVSPANAKIIDKNIIQLSKDGRKINLVFSATHPIHLMIRPSENPQEIINPKTGKNYEDFNAANKGTIMLGFDANIPANSKQIFKVTFIEIR